LKQNVEGTYPLEKDNHHHQPCHHLHISWIMALGST